MAQNPYTVDAGNDYSQGLAGLSNTLSNVRQARIQEADQKRKQEQYDRAQQRFQEVQGAAQEAFASQDPDQVAKIAIKYPEITEMLKQTTGLQDDMKNREALGFTRALATASPESRPMLYEQRIKSLQEQGRDPSHTIQSYEDYKRDPDSELRDVTSFWAGIDPKGYGAFSNEQKAAQRAQIEQQKLDQQQSLFNQAEAGRNQRAYARAAQTAGASTAQKQTAHMQDFKQYQELVKTDPEAAKAFGQAAGFVSKEGRELSPAVQKRLSLSIDSAVASENNVNKYNNLADQIAQSGMKGGLVGSVSETLKDLTGSQDAVTEMRKNAAQVKATQAVANMPPGSASDKDVKIFMGPFPSENASKEYLASWLRGQAKVEKLNADFNNFKADYISEKGSERDLLQSWKMQGKKGASSGGEAQEGQQGTPPAVTTQAQFDALPSGAVYMEDGQQYRKP